MFRPAFVMPYDVNPGPISTGTPMLPRMLETFTIVFFVLFSTRGRKTCAMYAGAATFVAKTCFMASVSIVYARSSPPVFCTGTNVGHVG